MVAPGPLVTDAAGRPCAIALPQVLIDGGVRDRCPYAGDQAVTGRTLLVSTPSEAPVLRAMILWYASHQRADGAIPASPYAGGTQVFFDFNAFWVEDLHDYVLYTGDLGPRPRGLAGARAAAGRLVPGAGRARPGCS